MALAYDAKSSATADDALSLTWAHTCSGSDRLLVVGLTLDGSALNVGNFTVTYDGVALTEIGRKLSGPGTADVGVMLWYLVAPATGTHDIVFTTDQVAAIIGGATSWTGADQSTPIGSFVSASGTSTAPTVDASSAAGEYVLDVVGGAGSGSATQGAGQTERWDDTALRGIYPKRGAGSQEDGAGTVTMSWTLGASVKWAIGAVPIKVATPPPTFVAIIYAPKVQFGVVADDTQRVTRLLAAWFALGLIEPTAPAVGYRAGGTPVGLGVGVF